MTHEHLPQRPSDPGGDHRPELMQRARTSALIISLTALLILPAWSFFDFALEPEHARSFLAVRLLFELPILLATVAVWRWRTGHPEALAFGVLALVQTEVAWMVSRADDNRQFYLLGFTLALYAGGLLLAGSVRWSVLLAAVTFATGAVFDLTAPHPMTSHELVAATTYLVTAAVIAVLSHLQRERLTTREFAVRTSLEREQAHGRALLERVERLSREDPLTGLANRRCWDEQLDAECERARRTGTELAVVLLDVDRFKEVNDRLGHSGGDEALCWVASVMTRSAPSHGLVARLGGDELAILLPDTTAEEATALAELIRRDVKRNVVSVTVSQGVSTARGEEAVPRALIHEADRELYRAKGTRDAVSVGGRSARSAYLPAQRVESDGPTRPSESVPGA